MTAEYVFVARLIDLAEERSRLEERRSVPGFDASGLSEEEWLLVSLRIAAIETEEQELARELRARLPALGISPGERLGVRDAGAAASKPRTTSPQAILACGLHRIRTQRYHVELAGQPQPTVIDAIDDEHALEIAQRIYGCTGSVEQRRENFATRRVVVLMDRAVVDAEE